MFDLGHSNSCRLNGQCRIIETDPKIEIKLAIETNG